MIALPIDLEDPYHDFEISLDGTTRTIHVRYSTREERFYLHVYSAEGLPVALGIKVVCDRFLLKDRQRTEIPGQFFARSNGADKSAPKLGELGLPSDNVRVNIYYIPEEEFLSLTNTPVNALPEEE